MRKNIIFSTTRQWNPGDEIILKGIINLLEGIGLNFNPIIFNRNPDIRNPFGMLEYRKKAEEENVFWNYIKSAMMDNSVKPWTRYENIDAIVFAGTPEWQGDISRELYINAIRYHIPVFLIGIDHAYRGDDPVIACVLKNAKFISIRNKEIEESFIKKGILAKYLPCPSIFACNEEKIIKKVKCIGLIYRGIEEQVTFLNGWNKENYQLQNIFFRNIISRYKKQYKFIIICHYVDEIYLAQKDFPEENVKYSYDSLDYLKIYKECDLVIGSRIHGIGMATAVGVPSIPFKYDQRAGTIDGFYPNKDIFRGLSGIEGVEACLSIIGKMNQELILHKKSVLEEYYKILKDKLDFKKVNYAYNYIEVENTYYTIIKNKLRKLDIDVSYCMKREFVKTALKQLNKIIEGKRILIKGGGNHTKELLKYLTSKTNIVSIVDNVLESFDGCPVIKNEDISSIEFDYIIISSYRYEFVMIDELEKLGYSDKILSIYRIIRDNFGPIDSEFYK